MDIPEDQIDDVVAATDNNFGEYLDGLEQAQQDDILGAGRAEMWRAGDLNLSEMIGQDGLFMTLGELKNELDQ
jgi:hypothetical protein